MSNKVKYNLKNVHAAKLTESVVDGVTSFSYDTPKAIPGAVSISLDAEGDSSPFYADGIVYFRTSSNNGYSGDLEMALIPEWFRTEILREKLDNKGVLVEKSDVTETEKFALLFEFDGDVKAIRHVLYNCSASRPSIESKTKEDTIEPGTETLSLTADPRSDGLVKSRTGDTTDKATYDGWYQTVYRGDASGHHQHGDVSGCPEGIRRALWRQDRERDCPNRRLLLPPGWRGRTAPTAQETTLVRGTAKIPLRVFSEP